MYHLYSKSRQEKLLNWNNIYYYIYEEELFCSPFCAHRVPSLFLSLLKREIERAFCLSGFFKGGKLSQKMHNASIKLQTENSTLARALFVWQFSKHVSTITMYYTINVSGGPLCLRVGPFKSLHSTWKKGSGVQNWSPVFLNLDNCIYHFLWGAFNFQWRNDQTISLF